MIDPLTLLVAGASAGAVLRLADAGAEAWVLRGRAGLVRAAAQLTTSIEVGGRRRDGATWFVRVPAVSPVSAGEGPNAK